MLTHGCETQRHLYRGCGSCAACTNHGVPAHIFAVTLAAAETLLGTFALRYAAKGDCRLFFDRWREPSSCGFWLSRRVIIQATGFFNGGSASEAPERRSAHRYRIWASHRRAVSHSAF